MIKNYIIKKILNLKIKRYGKIIDLKIDSNNKSVKLILKLKGEDKPLNISVNNYILFKKNNKYVVSFGTIKSSKDWLNLLINDFIKNKEIELSTSVYNSLNLIV